MDNLAYAYAHMTRKDVHSFITGHAGTGKSTLIREFIEDKKDECLICAPTGIAAINVGGVTIHKLFHFPANPISYSAVKRLNPEKDLDEISLWKACNYVIIDEISMVRADLMDQISWFLYKNSEIICGTENVPFAGIKLIMVGDLDQLPPVVQKQDMEKLLKRYNSPYFFDAACWNPERHAKFETIELTKIWRQTDPYFISLLNGIKTSQADSFDLDMLNNRCLDNVADNGGVRLCAINKDADDYNGQKINELESEAILLQAKVTGDISQKDVPVDFRMIMKVGARIMTLRNVGAYVNGSIGTITEIEQTKGYIMADLDSGETVQILPYVFEKKEPVVDEFSGRITYKVVGKCEQYPIRLAYAITIHKAQGQTFDKVIIDMGERGAFAHGQAYVALSRCRTIEGIILRRPLSRTDLIYDNNILSFNLRVKTI